jgi:two-component system, sporulation sensor kinase B
MDLQFDYILLQILMILFPIILYQALMNNRKLEKMETFYWGLVFTVTMGLCIIFAIKIDEGIFLDLRMVPWFLAYIYGGRVVGTFVTVFYVVLRFLVGGPGMIPAFIVLLLGTMVIWKFRSYYINWERKERILFSTLFLIGISALIPSVGILIFQKLMSWSRFFIDIGFVMANALSVWLAVHLMESYKEKQELVKQVQKNEKLQVVGQVAASVAHEIRNPMTSVRGFIQILSGSNNISEAEKGYLQICLDEIDRANEIISDYLSLGKNNELDEPGKINASKIASKSVNTLVSYATLHNVHLSLETYEDAYVIGHTTRLQQMLVNLIKNSIEATRPNGIVRVEVTIKGQLVEIVVEDDGAGMTSTQIENIGIPYYSTKDKGTGLGLMVTLQIIKEMNGNWNVTSQLNKGTLFKITLPLASDVKESSNPLNEVVS